MAPHTHRYSKPRLLHSILLLLLTMILVACSAPPEASQASIVLASATPEPIAMPDTPDTLDPTNTPVSISTATALPPTPVAPTSMPPTPTAVPLTPIIPTASAEPTVPITLPANQAQSGEILFLRDATLMAYNLDTSQERQIATDVHSFAATPDGRLLALARDNEQTHDLWLVDRSGDELRQVTSNDRIESSLSFAPDGQTLAYAASTIPLQQPLDWHAWAAWCGSSEVHLLDMTTNRETTLAEGCDPTFSPDGQRIAFATPPTDVGDNDAFPMMTNAIRLINRQGENGWNFARADGSSGDPDSGLLVYAPTWSPDSSQVAYHRFIGYRALVDLNMSEIGGSFEGNGDLLNLGAGWLRPPSFAPDGTSMAIVEHNFSDARGFSGYEAWRIQVLRLGDSDTVFMPDGQATTSATVVDSLSRVTSAAWLPDGTTLVVLLPAGWSADIPPDMPTFENTSPGDLWHWGPEAKPDRLLVNQVDFASPLLWLPPAL